MRVVVTGGTGFLGRHVVRRLLATDHEPVVVTRNQSAEVPGASLVHSSLESLSDLPDGTDAVCHLAAELPGPPTVAHAGACIDTNVIGTRRLLELCKSVRHFVFVSSANVYHPGDGSPATEDDGLAPFDRAPFYFGSKTMAEALILGWPEPMTRTIFRVSSIYGPGMPEHEVVARFVEAASSGGTLHVTNPDYRTDLVYVEDVSDLIVRSLDSPRPGVFNAASGRSLTLSEVAETVRGLFGPTARIEPGSGSSLGFRPLCVDHAVRAFDWQPRSLEAGLVAWRDSLRN